VTLLDFSSTELAKSVFSKGEGELSCGVDLFALCAGREEVAGFRSFLCCLPFLFLEPCPLPFSYVNLLSLDLAWLGERSFLVA
jgi:hypothetical protein